MMFGEYGPHLPDSARVQNADDPLAYDMLLAQGYRLNDTTGELDHFMYPWDISFAVRGAAEWFNVLDRNGVPVDDGEIRMWLSDRTDGGDAGVWAGPARFPASDGFISAYISLTLFLKPPPPPHPWSGDNHFVLYVGFLEQVLSDAFVQQKTLQPDMEAMLAERSPKGSYVYASTLGLDIVPPRCQGANLSESFGLYLKDGCHLQVANMPAALRDAYTYLADKQAGEMYLANVGGSEHFVRRQPVIHDWEIVWIKTTSSVESEVQGALRLLILFTALVLLFDIMIAVSEVYFIGLPLAAVARTAEQIGQMRTSVASTMLHTLQQRRVMLREMCTVVDGLVWAVQQLDEYRTFMPEAIFLSEPVLVGSHQEAPGRETGHAAVLFTDVQGSTKLWEACTEEMAEALRFHNTVIREMIAEHGGYEVKTIGDSFMVSFPDIDTAVRFGLRTQERLFQAAWPAGLLEVVQAPGDEGRGLRGLRVRMGLTHGAVNVDLNEVVQRCDYFGPTVNRAARLEANGVCGGVAVEASVVDSLTAVQQQQALVVQLGTRSLKGIGDIPLCLLVPQSMPQRAAHVHDVDVLNPLKVVHRFSHSGSCASTVSHESHNSHGMDRLVAVERFGSDKLSEVGSATTGYVDCEVVDLPCAEVTAMADTNLRGVVACLGRSDGRLLNVCGTAALVAWNVMAPCAGHLEAALRFASLMSGRAADGLHCGLSSGKVFSGYVATGKKRFVTAVGQCVQVSQRVYLTALQTEQVALFAAKDTQVTGAMVAHGLATAAGELRKGAEVYTVCALLCDVVASRVDRKQGLFNPATSAAKEDPVS